MTPVFPLLGIGDGIDDMLTARSPGYQHRKLLFERYPRLDQQPVAVGETRPRVDDFLLRTGCRVPVSVVRATKPLQDHGETEFPRGFQCFVYGTTGHEGWDRQA